MLVCGPARNSPLPLSRLLLRFPLFIEKNRLDQIFSLKKTSIDFLAFVSHSHITRTFQPSSSSFLLVSLSRFILSWNFLFQYSVLVFGVVAPRQLLCLCQKHPCTKSAVFLLGKIKSGEPGKSLLWRRNRSPRLWATERTLLSGEVFFDLIARMFSLRLAGDIRSAIF